MFKNLLRIIFIAGVAAGCASDFEADNTGGAGAQLAGIQKQWESLTDAAHKAILADDNAGAIDKMQRAVYLAETWGEDDMRLVTSLGALAELKAENKDFLGAKRDCKRAITVTLKDTSPQARNVELACRKVMAMIATAQNKPEEAIRQLSQVVEIHREHFADAKLPLAAAIAELARGQYISNDFALAANSAHEALTLYRANQEKESLDQAGLLAFLAELESRKDSFEKATTYFNKALTIVEAECGADSRELVALIEAYAACAAEAGELTKAEALCVRALNITRKLKSDDKTILIMPIERLGALRFALKKFDKGRKCFAESRAILSAAYGEADFRTIESQFRLLQIEMESENYNEAVKVSTELVGIMRSSLPADDQSLKVAEDNHKKLLEYLASRRTMMPRN